MIEHLRGINLNNVYLMSLSSSSHLLRRYTFILMTMRMLSPILAICLFHFPPVVHHALVHFRRAPTLACYAGPIDRVSDGRQ
jgi:hypothetical protein